MRTLPLLILGPCLGGCFGGAPSTAPTPDATIAPGNLDFGEVVLGGSSTAAIHIENAGKADLDVEDAAFQGTPSGAFSLDFAPLSLSAGETADVDVAFTPTAVLPYTDTVVLTTNDPDTPEGVVRLFGEGVGGAPDIAVDSLVLEFGTVDVGESTVQILQISNEGEGDLVLGALTLTGSDAFSLYGEDLSGATIAAGASATLALAYAPTDTTGDNATLSIPSNDPDEDPITVPLLGNGGGDYGFPVAVTSCPTDVRDLETVYFNGADSEDPGGHGPLLYSWTLVSAPEGSAARLSSGTTGLADLTVDVLGDYTVQLTVVNSLGISSDPAVCEFTVSPLEDIRTELSWDSDHSDLDLHLVRGGAALWDPVGDADFCNPHPDWGDLTSAYDDPVVSPDVTFGYGPESIDLIRPADDTYTVYVHDYMDHSRGPITATVSVTLSDSLVDMVRAEMSSNDVWEVGTISWPDGIFTPSAVPVAPATAVGCVK